MSEEVNKPGEVKWLRTLDNKYVYPATKAFLARNDLFACDINGVFISSGTVLPPVVVPEEPKVDLNDDKLAEDANGTRVQLLERANALGIKNAHTMKNETILAKISELEAAAK